MITPNLCVALSAPPKSGKTHFAFTFPKPLIIYSFDLRGAELILPPFKPDSPFAEDYANGNIVLRKMVPPIIESVHPDMEDGADAPFKAFASKIIATIKEDLKLGVDESCPFKTVVYDPSTTLWDVFRYAQEQQAEKQTIARKFGEPNAQMNWCLQQPVQIGCNVVATTYLKEEYRNNLPTGKMIPDCYKHLIGMADVALQMKREGEGKAVKFLAKITDYRITPEMTGYEFATNPTYKDLMFMLGFGVE